MTQAARSFSFLPAGLLLMAPIGVADPPDDEPAHLEKQRCPKPAEFALVFSFGYGSDAMPKEDERFEALLKTVKAGGFNTVHCTWTEKRLDLCKKHGVKMMVDLLADEHHVYKSPDKAEALCKKLRGNPDVWGYNVWNDTFAKTGAGRRRDVSAVRTWDATHPAYSGTYRTAGMSHLVNADILGYYDFHWKRGLDQHFPHLLAYRNWARERDAWFYSWLSATSGQPGKGNFNRSLWSASTAIACGQKGILWFLGTDLMDAKTLEWTETGRDITRVNQRILPLSRELARLGNPSAVHSTPVTRTPNNRPLFGDKKEALPPGLDKHAFPNDFWMQPAGGEFVAGIFDGPGKTTFAFVANHNAYAEQAAALRLMRPMRVSHFDRKTGRWEALEMKENVIRLRLDPGDGALLRFEAS